MPTLRLNPMALLAAALFGGLLLTACAPGAAPTATPTPAAVSTLVPGQRVAGLAGVYSVGIQILESFPVQVRALVKGELADNCTIIFEETQSREGDRFIITIRTLRQVDTACAQGIVPFERSYALDVAGLPKGVYMVEVNGVSAEFQLAADNVLSSGNASISGLVWHDLCASGEAGQPGPAAAPAGCMDGTQGGYQANGKLEAGEPGLAGVRVFLGAGACPAASELAAAITGEGGAFTFNDLQAGEYCVWVDSLHADNAALLPGGWTAPADARDLSAANYSLLVKEGERLESAAFGWDYQFLP